MCYESLETFWWYLTYWFSKWPIHFMFFRSNDSLSVGLNLITGKDWPMIIQIHVIHTDEQFIYQCLTPSQLVQLPQGHRWTKPQQEEHTLLYSYLKAKDEQNHSQKNTHYCMVTSRRQMNKTTARRTHIIARIPQGDRWTKPQPQEHTLLHRFLLYSSGSTRSLAREQNDSSLQCIQPWQIGRNLWVCHQC